MLRIGTLNVENLFARYNFRKALKPTDKDGFSVNEIAFDLYKEESRKITAALIKLMDADILALQEVENLHVLDRFNSKYLSRQGYKYRVLIDAFDRRKIDVALMSRYPIVHVRSYRHDRTENKRAWIFSRDCLEVDIDVDGVILRLYVNHFKSMIGGRRRTKAKRVRQVNRVAQIIDEAWADNDYTGNFIVLGDFNDYPGEGSALTALLEHSSLENIVNRLPEDERWTHYWAGGDEYSQLDYILVSKFLASKNTKLKPEIFRQGLPLRAEQYNGKRIKGVSENHPKASDHAGVVVELILDSDNGLLRSARNDQVMALSKKGRDLLKDFEGYKTTAYLDQAGVATIGYGTTKYEDGNPVKIGDKITKKKAEELLIKDISWAQNAINQLVKKPLSQNQFDALVSFVFNIGETQFKSSSLLKKLNSNKAHKVEDEFLRWVYAGNKISQGLKNRRIKERALFIS